MDPIRSLYIPRNFVVYARYRVDKSTISKVKVELKEGTTLYESLLLFFHNEKQFPVELQKRFSRSVYVLALSLINTSTTKNTFQLPSNKDLVLLTKQWNKAVLPKPLVFTEFGKEGEIKKNKNLQQEIQLIYYQQNDQMEHRLKLKHEINEKFIQNLRKENQQSKNKEQEKNKQNKNNKKKKENDSRKSITNKVEFGLVQKMNVKFTRCGSYLLTEQRLSPQLVLQEEISREQITSKENFQATIMLIDKDFKILNPIWLHYFECTPELCFPTVFEQLEEMKQKQIQIEKEQEQEQKQKQEQEQEKEEEKEQKKIENKKSPIGQVLVTKHSNLKNINLIFWIVTDKNEQEIGLESKLCKAISFIIKNVTKFRINKLSLPLKQLIGVSNDQQQEQEQEQDQQKLLEKSGYICKAIMDSLVLFVIEKLSIFLSLEEIVIHLGGCKFDFESYFRKKYKVNFI
ncbi:hypothetical protein M0812_11334 [Anaeramoeba flamelloides]|uniref:Uncharacterized protein n=1 Tax=Anaeramoeba flamelloides TaxID=1746091 RepID=A0AAV7ZW89_9EUKA|nr:hypothetical protein M0812_11334 [Anaeramoeba flamelloides]